MGIASLSGNLCYLLLHLGQILKTSFQLALVGYGLYRPCCLTPVPKLAGAACMQHVPQWQLAEQHEHHSRWQGPIVCFRRMNVSSVTALRLHSFLLC
jgi:hypothetical protein